MGKFPRQEIEATTTSIFMSPRDPRSTDYTPVPPPIGLTGLVSLPPLYSAEVYQMTRFYIRILPSPCCAGCSQPIKSWTYRNDSSLVLVINHQLLFHKTMLITEITVITVIFRSSDRPVNILPVKIRKDVAGIRGWGRYSKGADGVH